MSACMIHLYVIMHAVVYVHDVLYDRAYIQTDIQYSPTVKVVNQSRLHTDGNRWRIIGKIKSLISYYASASHHKLFIKYAVRLLTWRLRRTCIRIYLISDPTSHVETPKGLHSLMNSCNSRRVTTQATPPNRPPMASSCR